MSRLRSILFFAFALLMLDLAAAAPAEAQGRGRGHKQKSHQVQSMHRSGGRSHDDRVSGRRHKGEDSDEDSDSDSDSEDGRRGRDSRARNDRRDACVDVNRDGRCDYSPTGRYPDARYPDSRYPDTRSGVLRRTRLPLSQLLGAFLAGH
jgi:hypothetical protein